MAIQAPQPDREIYKHLYRARCPATTRRKKQADILPFLAIACCAAGLYPSQTVQELRRRPCGRATCRALLNVRPAMQMRKPDRQANRRKHQAYQPKQYCSAIIRERINVTAIGCLPARFCISIQPYSGCGNQKCPANTRKDNAARSPDTRRRYLRRLDLTICLLYLRGGQAPSRGRIKDRVERRGLLVAMNGAHSDGGKH